MDDYNGLMELKNLQPGLDWDWVVIASFPSVKECDLSLARIVQTVRFLLKKRSQCA